MWKEQRCEGELRGHADSVTCVRAWTDEMLLSASYDATVRQGRRAIEGTAHVPIEAAVLGPAAPWSRPLATRHEAVTTRAAPCTARLMAAPQTSRIASLGPVCAIQPFALP